jgi:hypothetical protein
MQGQSGHRDQDFDVKDADSAQPGEWQGSQQQAFVQSMSANLFSVEPAHSTLVLR